MESWRFVDLTQRRGLACVAHAIDMALLRLPYLIVKPWRRIALTLSIWRWWRRPDPNGPEYDPRDDLDLPTAWECARVIWD